ASRSSAEGSVSHLPSGSVEAELSPVLDPGSMTRSATAASRPRCTWVSTRPDGGGLEMRWVSRPDPKLAQRGDQPAFPVSMCPDNTSPDGHPDASPTVPALFA